MESLGFFPHESSKCAMYIANLMNFGDLHTQNGSREMSYNVVVGVGGKRPVPFGLFFLPLYT